MKIQALGLLTAVGALVVASAGALTSCSQPPIECTAGHGDFAVRYIPVSGDPACNVKPPEHVGFQVYNPLTNQDKCKYVGIPSKGDGESCATNEECTSDTCDTGQCVGGKAFLGDLICEDTEADATKVIIGMQTEEVGYSIFTAIEGDPDLTHKTHSVGSVTNVLPDADGFCFVPTLTAAHQDFLLPGIPAGGGGAGGGGGAPPDPPPTAKDVKYEWSNLKIYVTAAAPGTQFEADLAYTKDGCSATFKAIGMYPAIDCSADDPTTPEFETDPTVCNPNPDPDQGRVFGSGINPDFPTRCEPMIDLDGLDVTGDGEPDGLPDGVPDGALCVLDRDVIPGLR